MLLRLLKQLFGPSGPTRPQAEEPGALLLSRLGALCESMRGGNAAQAAGLAGTTLSPANKNPLALGALARAGRLDTAIARYAEIVEFGLEPEVTRRAWEELAYCHALRGDVERSVQAFDQALLLGAATERGQAGFDELYHRGLAVTQTWESPRRRRRFFHLVGFVEQCAALGGECAECGCWRGLSSYLICRTLRRFDSAFNGLGYHVFDSFQGLSEPTPLDGGAGRAGQFSAGLEEVRKNLSEFPDIEFHPGWIPETFAGLPERRYRFVHVDVDLYEPTHGAIRYFVPRLVSGGILVCDDYNWPGARKAIGDYQAAGKIILSLTDASQAVIRAA